MFRIMNFLNWFRGQDTYSYVTNKCGNGKFMKFNLQYPSTTCGTRLLMFNTRHTRHNQKKGLNKFSRFQRTIFSIVKLRGLI